MSNNELEILLTLRDKATAQLKKFRSATQNAIAAMKKNWIVLAAAIAAVIIVIKKAAEALLKMGNELIRVNSVVENLQVRLTVLTGSVEAGNKVFADMRDLASQVPQTYEDIMSAATDLTAVIDGGSEELNKLMPIILDLSAATGIGVQETTSQMIRMYSAGAAAADLFRERGVLAALGFQAGVSISNEETIDIIIKQWEDGTGKFVGATKMLSSTFSGQVSMMEDAWFNFKQQIGEPLFEKARLILSAMLKTINDSREATGGYDKIVKDLGNTFSEMFDTAVHGAGLLFVAVGQVVDILNEVNVVVKGVQGAWLGFIAGIFEAADALASFPLSPAGFFVDVDANRAALDEVKSDMQQITDEIRDLRIKADVDYSIRFKEIMGGVMNTYNEMKILVIKNEGEMNRAKEEGAKIIKKIGSEQQKQVNQLTKATEKAFSGAISSMILGTMTAKEAFAELGKTMIKVLVDFIAEQLVAAVLSKIIASAMTIFVTGQAAIIAAAWAPAAALASLATLGGNAIPAAAAIASTSLVASLAAVPKPVALAEGGIITRPTLALIGEAGPEAVVPLGSNNGLRSVHIEVNISEPQVRSLDDIFTLSEEVSDQIAKEIERL